MAHYDIFRDQLGIKYPAFGHALWEPNPGSLYYSPVEVGDVGFIREGKFHRLFNALLPADHPSHQRFGVPEHYEPLQPNVAGHLDSGTLTPNDFCSYGVNVAAGGLDIFAREPVGSADVSFLCARKSGAVLSLPVTAQREDTIARGDFAKWITRHIDSWFAFTRRRGLGIDQMEDIVFVTGRHRTRSWTNIAFYEGQVDAQVTFGVQVTDNVGTPGSVNWQVERRHIQGAMLSQGPSGEDLPEDQCIFIRGFRVTRAFKLFPRLRGAAGHSPDSSEHESEPELEVMSIPSFTKYRDPLHVLLEYIAERAPNCDLVLVHDDDLDRLRRLGDGTSLETFQPDAVVSCLRRSEPEISQVACDSLSSENIAPKTNTRGSMVAMFSEELNSWGNMISWGLPTSLTQDATGLAAANVLPLSSCTKPDHDPGKIILEDLIHLQRQQGPADEAEKQLARELLLPNDRLPSSTPATKPDSSSQFLSSSTITAIKQCLMPVGRIRTERASHSNSVKPSPFDAAALLRRFTTPSPYIGLSSESDLPAAQLTAGPSCQELGIGVPPTPFDTVHKYILTCRGRDYATVLVVSRAPNIQDHPLLHFGDELNGHIVIPRGYLSDMQSMEAIFQLFEADPIKPSYEITRTLSPQKVDESCISGGQFIWSFLIAPPPCLSSPSSSTEASSCADSSLGHLSPPGHYTEPRVQLLVTIYRRGRLTRNLGLRQPIHYVLPPDPALTSPRIPSSISTELSSNTLGKSLRPPVDPPWAQQKFPRVVVRGVIFRRVQVQVECKLIVPVSHPVSDVIPLRLVVTSEHREALEILAVPDAIDVRLRKVLAFGENAANIHPFTLRNRSSSHRTDWVAKAQWEANVPHRELPPSDEHPRARWRIKLNGELHRDQSVEMSESFEQPGMALMYLVCLFPFRSTNFHPASDPKKELLMGKLPITRVGIAPPLRAKPPTPPPATRQQLDTDAHRDTTSLTKSNEAQPSLNSYHHHLPEWSSDVLAEGVPHVGAASKAAGTHRPRGSVTTLPQTFSPVVVVTDNVNTL